MLSGFVETGSFVWTVSLSSSVVEDMSPVRHQRPMLKEQEGDTLGSQVVPNSS